MSKMGDAVSFECETKWFMYLLDEQDFIFSLLSYLRR
jgi:hypothetical protein